MSKELNVIDNITEQADTAATELVKIDDLSLVLVGGGMGAVCL